MKNTKQESLLGDLMESRNLDSKQLHEKATELTRQRLLLAAMECFAEKGYHNSNIREIANKAGVTKGAVYHHFKDKKDMFISVNLWRQDYASRVLRRSLSEEEDFLAGLRNALQGLFSILHTDSMMRGLVREYIAMAMTDSDVNRMYSQDDTDLIGIMVDELGRRRPDLPKEKRAALLQRLYVALEGLFMVLAVDSPIITEPEKMLEDLIDTYRPMLDE